MYNLLISLAISVAVFALTMLAGFEWVAGIAPALLTFPVAMFLLARRTHQQVTAALAPVQAMMAEVQTSRTQAEATARLGKVAELLVEVRDTWGPWQLLLTRQVNAQLGMLLYTQLQFDEALPLLEGAWRDWTASAAAACVHVRRGRLDAAWKAFEDAAAYGDKEITLYVVWATLRARHGDRDAALAVVRKGLEAVPDNATLKALQAQLANKRRIDPASLGETWYRFFPEEAAQQAMVRGRRGPIELPGGAAPRMVQGPPQPRARGKLARRR
ncbi:MAG: hypothetical protein H6733_15780 [Alphaproteobacteria bacterium]|nr:hypothetical protein [Alphaproteobacteria bacterium]